MAMQSNHAMTLLEVAHACNLHTLQKGGKHWACCPLHGEKTASLCLYPDGRWYCFGCHAHGDAVELYRAMQGVSMSEALRVVKGESKPSKPTKRTPTAYDLRKACEAWKSDQWRQACDKLHGARATMDSLTEAYGKAVQDMPPFWEAVETNAHANDRLNHLEHISPSEMIQEIMPTR